MMNVRESLDELCEAAKLKRNTVITGKCCGGGKTLKGRWVAVPEEDFDRLRAALAAALAELRAKDAKAQRAEDLRKAEENCGSVLWPEFPALWRAHCARATSLRDALIKQFDGKMPRAEAERQALEELRKRKQEAK